MAREHSPKRRRLDIDRFATSNSRSASLAPSRRHELSHQRIKDGSHTPGTVSRASTPRGASHYATTPRQHEFDGPEPAVKLEDSNALDRDWYGGEENGHTFGDETHNPFGPNLDDSWAEKQREAAQSERKNARRVNAHAAQKQKDVDAWETNRMLTSGVAQRRDFRDDFDDDDDATRVHLLVHDLKPPFLDGKTVFTKQLEPISAVLDPQSDMAVLSRKGSRVVKEKRQQKERQKQAQEATNMAGTALGNLIGVKEGDDTDSAAPTAGEGDGGGGNRSKFAEHLKANDAQSAFSKSKSLREQREYLPAFAVREDLLRVIRDNQVVVVVGQTGSGKTTQLTQFLHEDGYAARGLIGCTQPRRVAAMSVAKRVSEEMAVPLGGLVGYAIRFEDCTSRATAIKYMTDGVLLREFLTDPELSKYSCVIMDEAHERALNTDILMGLFKQLLARRRDLKLIVTSATLDSRRFADFFGGAPEFLIPGRAFPVDVQYARAPCDDYVDGAVRQALAIHVSQGPGDVLIFMTGQEDIEVTCALLAERLALLDNPPPLSILPIYSQMPADLQARIFERAAPGVRKVIVATNIAETSLTVDGIAFVVDAGFSKLKVYNPRVRMDALQVTPISQANARQRAGRAGRTGPGRAFHLYTERAFRDEMYPQTIPEIQRTNLANTVLLLKSLRVDDLLAFPFLDAPPADAIATALFDLWALGALDNLGALTPLGAQMAAFPMDPALSKLLLTAASPAYACAAEMLTVVAMLSVPSVFYRPKERLDAADAAREKFAVPDSDHLTLLHVHQQWAAAGRSDAWCAKHFLHAKALRRAAEIRAQLADLAGQQGLAVASSAGADWDVLRKAVCAGYYHQAARARGVGEYAALRSSVAVALHPTSALYGLGALPPYVCYHELVLTSKEYMSTVTAVDPRWLAELGGVFYALREKAFDAVGGNVTEQEYSMRASIEQAIERDRRELERRRQIEAKGSEVRRELDVSVAPRVKTVLKTVGAVRRPVVVRKRGGI